MDDIDFSICETIAWSNRVICPFMLLFLEIITDLSMYPFWEGEWDEWKLFQTFEK